MNDQDLADIIDRKRRIEFVREYLVGKVVSGYIVSDLQKLLQIPVVENADGNCNFPIALYCFTSIEFIGRLLVENVHVKDEEKIDYYIDHYFTEMDKAALAPHRKEFANVYRNGLVHEFFPKMAGIGRKGSVIMSTYGGQWILDADLFAAMFIRSINILREDTNINEELCLRMYDRYAGKQKTYYQLKILRPNISTSAIASGATTTMIPAELLNKAKLTKTDID